MANTKITPEKITTPIQLVAAWFAILFLLNSAFLATAIKIEHPAWGPAFLLILAAATTVLVLFFVGLMLTVFRPHLQEGKEYAKWLKEKNSYSAGLIVQEHTGPTPASTPTPTCDSTLPSIEASQNDCSFRIDVNGQVAGWATVLQSLISAGFDASKYEDPYPFPNSSTKARPDDQACIWLGERISARGAIGAMKIAVEHWPHLKYIELSTDGATPPDEVHDQMFLGGATSTALERRLLPWTADEIKKLPDNLSRRDFHLAIRAKYS